MENNSKIEKNDDGIVCVITHKTFQDYAWLSFDETILTEKQLKKAEEMFWKRERSEDQTGPVEGAILSAIDDALNPHNY